MNHATTDSIVAVCAILGILVALIVPYMMRSDAKRTMAETSGEIKATLGSHGQRLDKAEESIQQHTADIGYLKGRANGQAAGYP